MLPQKRKKLRLQEYNYSSAGGYFLTICTHRKACTLSRIIDNGACNGASVCLSALGKVAEETLISLTSQHSILLDSYVIMPNHIHAIVIFADNRNDNLTLGRFVGAFKSIVVHKWLEICNQKGVICGKLWQRNYYEHVLRNDLDYFEKRTYIENNPVKWCMDDEFVPS